MSKKGRFYIQIKEIFDNGFALGSMQDYVDIMNDLDKQNENKDKQISELKQQLAEKDKYIDELEQEREFMLDEVKNRGTCGLCEKLEEKAINVLRDKLKEKDKEIEKLQANQTPTRKRLTPKNWDKYNLADKLRYRNSQVKEALIRFSEMNEMEDVLRNQLKDQRHQICEKIREFIEQPENSIFYDVSLYIETEGLRKKLDQIERNCDEK